MADPVSYPFSQLPGDAYGADSWHPVSATDFMNTGSANELAGFMRIIETWLRQIKSSEQWDRWLGITPPNSPSASAPTFISTTQFSLPGDWTSASVGFYPPIMVVNRRIQATVTAGTVYGYISAASFGGGITTVTVVLDSGALDSGLSEVMVGSLVPGPTGNTGVPQNIINAIANPVYIGTAAGTNAYTTTLAPAPASLAALQGSPIFVTFANANTNAANSTLAPNGFAATPIRKYSNGSIVEMGVNDIELGIGMLIYDGTQFLLAGILNQVPQFDGAAGARNLRGSTSGNAQFTVTADLLLLRPSAGSGKMILPGFSGGATVNTSTAGPALNGRDQAGAFSNGATVHVYAIGGLGQTTGLIVSTNASTPTLPTNYTNYAYLFTMLLSGGSPTNFIAAAHLVGDTVFYDFPQLLLNSAGSSGTQSMATLVPALAMLARLWVGAFATGAVQATAIFGLTGTGVGNLVMTTSSVAGKTSGDDTEWTIPNIGSFQYNIVGAGTVFVLSYTIPNNS